MADAAKFPPTPFDPSAHTGEEFPILWKLAILDETPGRDYPSKVYVQMLNNTGGCAEVMTSRWLSGIKAELLQDVLQLWLGYDWFPVPHGIARLHVAPGERFRLWIAPDKQYRREELQRLCDDNNFGTVMIRVNGKERGIIL